MGNPTDPAPGPEPKSTDPSKSPGELSVRRLERVADIIFGVSFLLLLVTIDLAVFHSDSAEAAYAYLWKNINQTLGFAISYLVIAYYWISHQKYLGYIKRTNTTHSFIELFYLMAIAGMPVNNHFIATFPNELAPRFAISMDILFAGLLSYFSWRYATKGNRLIDPEEITPDVAGEMSRQALVMPSVAIIAAGAALLHPFAWDLILFIGPLLAIPLLKRIGRKSRRTT